VAETPSKKKFSKPSLDKKEKEKDDEHQNENRERFRALKKSIEEEHKDIFAPFQKKQMLKLYASLDQLTDLFETYKKNKK